VVYWCNSYTIVHFSLDIIEWFKYKLKKVCKLYLILIHPPLGLNIFVEVEFQELYLVSYIVICVSKLGSLSHHIAYDTNIGW
jgi:hypothetical protein